MVKSKSCLSRASITRNGCSCNVKSACAMFPSSYSTFSIISPGPKIANHSDRALAASPYFSLANIKVGTIVCSFPEKDTCQETPNLSTTQPYKGLKGYSPKGINICPSVVKFFHNVSVCDNVLHSTKNELAGVKENSGPPFKPMIVWFAKVNSMVINDVP